MAARHPIHVSLTEPLIRHVRDRVAAGHYTIASEVLREALHLLIARDAEWERAGSNAGIPIVRHD